MLVGTGDREIVEVDLLTVVRGIADHNVKASPFNRRSFPGKLEGSNQYARNRIWGVG